MPKHRGLTLRKFLKAVDYELLDKYFVQLVGEEELPKRVLMNEELVEQFLDNPANVVAAGIVREHFQRMNDLSKAGKSTLVWTCNHYGISWEENETPENMAMRLFVDHPDGFKHAYAWYTWHNCASRMSEYRMPADEFKLTKTRLRRFQKDVTQWFSSLAKGDTTDVRFYEQDSATVILLTHGSYVRTVAEWEGDRVQIRSFRPATEDILMYDPEKGILRMKATLEKDRKQYVQSFAGKVLEDIAAAEDSERQPAYTLEPFRTGEFDFGGSRDITEIVLLEVKIELGGETEPRIHLKSKDLRKTLQEELPGLGLATGDLTYVKLRFFLRMDDKETRETIEIAPPERSDLPGAKNQEVISQYLKEQGVKLI